jgi:hypothetical protein
MSRLFCARYRQRQTGQSRRHRIDDAMMGQYGPTSERARRDHEPVRRQAHGALASADTEFITEYALGGWLSACANCSGVIDGSVIALR